MSFARGFSMRRRSKTPDVVSAKPSRSLSLMNPKPRNTSSRIDRHKISGPTELISTTSLMTPNPPKTIHTNALRSSFNSGDSEISVPDFVSSSSITSPDSSSIESSSPYLEPNHLSCYFGAPIPEDEPPSIPRRSSSRTKTKKSIENFLSRTLTSRISSSSKKTKLMARSSLSVFFPRTEAEDQHTLGHTHADHRSTALPFIVDLEDRHDTSQQFIMVDPEEQELISRGFQKFDAEDYMNEINEIKIRVYVDLDASSSTWI